MSQNKIALKPYLEAIEKYCTGLSREELTATIINFAKEIPVNERQTFLSRLCSFSPLETQFTPDEAESITEDIFNEIEALKEDIKERIDSIENGSYWENMDYEDDHNYGSYGYEYDDQEVDYVSEDQCNELIDIFEEAEQLFLDDQIQSAREVYERLFQLFEELDELEQYMPENTDRFDIRESRARYCRCVYKTADRKNRVKEVMEAIGPYASISSKILSISNEKYPVLQDLIDAGTGDLENWDDFLKEWLSAMEEHQSGRAATLLLEAVEFIKGVNGISDLAREWGETQPRGFLYWIQLLLEKEDWQVASLASIEALDVLSNGSFREQAAGYLSLCGENLADKSLILSSKREKLISAVTETNILDFVDEANSQGVRDAELAKFRDIITKPEFSELVGSRIYTKFVLVSGDINTAFHSQLKGSCIGWSSGSTGLVFCAALYIISGRSDRPTTITKLLRNYTEGLYGYSLSHTGSKQITMYDEIMIGLKQCKSDAGDNKEMWEWAQKIGCDRIDHIVSNKHRNAYERAAAVLGALAECFILLDEKDKAQSFVKDFYSNRYKRFSAFRREIKGIFASSEMLTFIRF